MRLFTRILVVLMLSVVFAGCGPTTFIISKGNRAYYLGRKSDSLYEMLCRSGDLEKILAETSMSDELRQELFRYTCTEERSKEKVVALYNFLTPEEKKDFQDAFRRHDYTINYVPC